MKLAIQEIIDGLRNLNHITINNLSYPITKYLGGDLKMLAILYGINKANSQFPCIWCEFNVMLDSVNYQQQWPITRCLCNQGTRGLINEPIIDFIDFKFCVVDTLHLFLRLAECLFRGLISIINILDNSSSANIEDRIYLKRFFDFLEINCGIKDPLFVKETNNERVFKMRTINSNQLVTIFTKMYENGGNLFKVLGIDISTVQDQSLSYRLRSYNFLLYEFYELYKLSKNDSSASDAHLPSRLNQWAKIYSSSGSFNSDKYTPYLHIFVHHINELILLHNNINNFNCQGLEKYNDQIKNIYFRCTNRHENDEKDYLHQILLKRNRLEFFDLD